MSLGPTGAGAARPAPLIQWLRRPIAVATIAVAALTLLGWGALLVEASRGGFTGEAFTRALCRPVAFGRGGDLGDVAASFLVSVGLWIAMSLAMMLPTAAPMVLTYAEIAETAAARGRRAVSPLVLVAGYAAVWVAVAVAAAALQTLGAAFGPKLGLPETVLAILAGTAIGAAGLYQFSEIKNACLTVCRHPFPTLFGRWSDDPARVVRLGIDQGLKCFGCCWALMALMLVAGAMNLFWMAVFSLLMAVEKTSNGPWVPRAIGILLVGAGVLVALSAVGLDSVGRWLMSR
jgi:predicted metal-binding membrane protein